MDGLIQGLLAWVHAHPAWAGAAVFLVAMGESLLVVGLVVPGTVLMFGIGALVGSGALGLWETLAWAFAGAVAGDGLSFWLGHHFRDRIRTWWPFAKHPELLARGEAFFRRHGGKSVLIGRFVGPVRPIIPAVAGMLGMAPAKFLAVNVLSALLWAPAYLLPGIAFGTSLTLASQVAARLAVFLALVVGLAWAGVWLALRLYRWAVPRAARGFGALLRWLQTRPRLAPLGRMLAHPGAHPAAVLSAGAGCILLVAGAAGLLAPLPADLEMRWGGLMDAIATPWGDRWMGHLAALSTLWGLSAVAVVTLLWWWHQGDRPALWAGLASACLAAVLWLLGGLFPHPPLSPGLFAATVVWGLPVVTSARRAGRLRPLMYAVWGLLVTLLFFARVYLGLDAPLQGLAGLSAGLAWVGLAEAVHHDLQPQGGRPEVLGLVLVAALLAALPPGPAPQRPVLTPLVVERQDWWERRWADLPAYRVDLGGEREQPLTVQWGGELEALDRHLRRHGWTAPPPPDWRTLLNVFRDRPPVTDLPIFPQLHQGRPEALRRIQVDGEGVWILRLWPSGLVLAGGGRVWQGYVARLRREQPLDFLALARTERDFDRPRRHLAGQLAGLRTKTVRRQEIPASPVWDGQVLLVQPGESP